MDRQHIRTLSELGLSENEARVYLAALMLGPTSVLRIAKTAGLKRTTVYPLLESLRRAGLVHEELRGFKKVFVAENPRELESMLEARRRTLQDALPELSALYNLKSGDDTIRFFEGIEATKSIYESLLADIRPNEDYMVYSAMTAWYNLDPEYLEKFTLRRGELSRRLGFRIRLLLQDSPITRRHKKNEKTYNEKIKILPSSVSLTTNVVVIPRKGVIHQLVPPIHAMVIHNPNVIRLHRETFELLWNLLPDVLP